MALNWVCFAPSTNLWRLLQDCFAFCRHQLFVLSWSMHWRSLNLQAVIVRNRTICETQSGEDPQCRLLKLNCSQLDVYDVLSFCESQHCNCVTGYERKMRTSRLTFEGIEQLMMMIPNGNVILLGGDTCTDSVSQSCDHIRQNSPSERDTFYRNDLWEFQATTMLWVSPQAAVALVLNCSCVYSMYLFITQIFAGLLRGKGCDFSSFSDIHPHIQFSLIDSIHSSYPKTLITVSKFASGDIGTKTISFCISRWRKPFCWLLEIVQSHSKETRCRLALRDSLIMRIDTHIHIHTYTHTQHVGIYVYVCILVVFCTNNLWMGWQSDVL